MHQSWKQNRIEMAEEILPDELRAVAEP